MKNTRTIKFNEFCFFTLAVAIASYIAKPSDEKPYVFLIVPLFLLFLLFLCKKKKIDTREGGVYFLTFFLVGMLLIKMAFSSNPTAHLYVLNILVLPMTIFFGTRINHLAMGKVIRTWFYLSFAVFGIEWFHRMGDLIIGNNIMDSINEITLSFYTYKMPSLMYENSNGVGMHAVMMLALLFGIYGSKSKSLAVFNESTGFTRNFFWYGFAGLIFFIISSLSRAAIVASILLTVSAILTKNKTNMRAILLVTLIISIAAFAAIFGGDIRILDSSLMSKFDIFANLIIYFQNAPLISIMVGTSLDPPNDLYGFFSGAVGHTHYFDLVVKLGVLLSITYITIFFIIAKKTQKVLVFIFLAFFILGLSSVRIFAHYLFFVLGLGFVYAYHYRNFTQRTK